MGEGMSHKEFVSRFTAHMLKLSGPNANQGEIIHVATQEAEYYASYGARYGGPEECAEDAMSYWGEG